MPREAGFALKTVYVIEDRRLPDGEWTTTEDGEYFEHLEDAKERAREWEVLGHDDGARCACRVVSYALVEGQAWYP